MSRVAFVAIGLGMIVASHSESAPSERLSDAAASKVIVGKWVSSDERPTRKLETICATDESDWFFPAGKYQGLYEEGTWSIRKRVLIISITRSNASSGGEGPMKRLAKPEVRKFTIESLTNGLGKVRTSNGSAWLVRCGD